jgi:hypothetical protein
MRERVQADDLVGRQAGWLGGTWAPQEGSWVGVAHDEAATDDADRWWGCKQGLILLHTLTGATRLFELFRMLAADPRIRWQFCQPPDVFGGGVREFLAAHGFHTVPWDVARRRKFDVVLAAGGDNLHELPSRIILLAHGAGTNKLGMRRAGPGLPLGRSPYRLNRDYLIRGGRVVPYRLALSHDKEQRLLEEQVPEVLPIAEVIGDPVVDQIQRHRHLRDEYRNKLEVQDERTLVVVTSTGTGSGLLMRRRDLVSRLMRELPATEYKVVLMLHPNFWAYFTPAYLRTWLAEPIRRGLEVLPVDEDWPALLLAADLVIGDHGSATQYGAAAGAAILLGSHPMEDLAPSAPAMMLAALAPHLVEGKTICQQVKDAIAGHKRGQYSLVANQLSSTPGEFGRRLGDLIIDAAQIDSEPLPSTLPALVVPRLMKR